jgi:hypothetical protein
LWNKLRLEVLPVLKGFRPHLELPVIPICHWSDSGLVECRRALTFGLGFGGACSMWGSVAKIMKKGTSVPRIIHACIIGLPPVSRWKHRRYPEPDCSL